MADSEADQGWKEIQDRIGDFFGHLLRGDVLSIEYKPQVAIPLLEMPPRYREYKSPEIE